MTISSLSPRKRIVIMPIYNEEKGLDKVLENVMPRVNAAIAVNDCSTDRTKKIIDDWADRTGKIIRVHCKKNNGASTALRKGYLLVSYLLNQKLISPDDLIIEMDADGQHDPKCLTELCNYYEQVQDKTDIVLARRDFSVYPKYKIFGNMLLTGAASILSGCRYLDVESNFRVMPAKHFSELLKWFSGYRYSGAFEVGIILGRLKKRTDNSYIINVPLYRHGAGIMDGFHVLWMGLFAFFRIISKNKVSDSETLLEETLAETTFMLKNIE